MVKLKPAWLGILRKLAEGALVHVSQATNRASPTRAWLSDETNVRFEMVVEMQASGLLVLENKEDTPWYRADYRISELGKQLLTQAGSRK